jgi:hypothetical protein
MLLVGLGASRKRAAGLPDRRLGMGITASTTENTRLRKIIYSHIGTMNLKWRMAKRRPKFLEGCTQWMGERMMK